MNSKKAFMVIPGLFWLKGGLLLLGSYALCTVVGGMIGYNIAKYQIKTSEEENG